MFGLFDKPRTAIRKTIPVSSLIEYAAVETLTDMRLKVKLIEGFQREAAVGFVLSVWASNSAWAGKFHLNSKIYQFVLRTGLNYGGRMQPTVSAAAKAILRGAGGFPAEFS